MSIHVDDTVSVVRDAKKRWPNLIAILVTGFAHLAPVEEAKQGDLFFGIVEKPIVLHEFKTLVDTGVASLKS